MEKFSNMNIFLIGMMGSGKSTIGKIMAAVLDLKFVDLDLEVERLAGSTVKEIFEKSGEEHFRTLETRCLRNIVKNRGLVIATGGGVIIREINREIITASGAAVLLKPELDLLAIRLNTSRERPLLTDGKEMLSKLEDLWEARRYYYEKTANITVNPKGKPTDAVREIIQKLELINEDN